MSTDRKKLINQSVSVCPIWPQAASEKVGKMLEEISQSNQLMQRTAATAQNSAIKGGFAAETWHAESFNLDAILKDKNVRAFTDNFKNSPLSKNHNTHDILVMNGDEQLLGAQLKYFKNPEATQKAFRSTKGGAHQYAESDVFLGPSDQLEGIKLSAKQDMRRNQEIRPNVSEAAKKVHDGAADKLQADGVESTKLSKREAEQLGKGSAEGNELHEQMQRGYLNKATVQQSLRAAGSAAVITAVIAGTINTFQYVQKVKEGEMSAEDAAMCILKETAIAAGDSALKAGVATATVCVTTRSLPTLFAGSVFQRTFASGGVAGLAVCAVDFVQCLVLYSVGKMSAEEFETRTGKNLFQTGAGVTGASIGATVGAAGGPIGMLIGSLVGGMITTLAMSIAIDNKVEARFKLTLDNTQQLVSCGVAMQESLNYLKMSQEFYQQFNAELYLSERRFESKVDTLKAQSQSLKDKISRL